MAVYMTDQCDPRRTDEVNSHPIDRYVGRRVRLRRMLVGMSQEQLGRALRLTFQQVQKYENGLNRIGASRLFEISRILNVPVAYFFDEMPDEISLAPLSGPRGRTRGIPEHISIQYGELDNKLADRETLELVKSYYRIPDSSKRKILFDLVNILASP